MTNVVADDDDGKKARKKAATLASFICILQWARVASRQNFKVGIIKQQCAILGYPVGVGHVDGDGDGVDESSQSRQRVAMVIDVVSEPN